MPTNTFAVNEIHIYALNIMNVSCINANKLQAGRCSVETLCSYAIYQRHGECQHISNIYCIIVSAVITFLCRMLSATL